MFEEDEIFVEGENYYVLKKGTTILSASKNEIR